MSSLKVVWGWVLVGFGVLCIVGGFGAIVGGGRGSFQIALFLKALGLAVIWTGVRRIREARALRSIPPNAVLAELRAELLRKRAKGASYEELVGHAMRVGLSRSAAETLVVRLVQEGGM